MPTADRIASLLLVLMLVQSLLGLLLSDQYRDVEWIKVTWYGNDWVTLVAAVPLLSLALLHTGGESVRARLLVLGMAGYAVYNYAFYLFGAALNVFFPLYVVSFLLGILTLGRFLSHLDVTVVADSFRRVAPVRLVGGYLVFVAVGLAVVLRTDNGPEFCSRAMLTWAYERGLTLRLIQPGKPNGNALIESFNGAVPR